MMDVVDNNASVNNISSTIYSEALLVLLTKMVTVLHVTPAEAAALIATESRSLAIASAPTIHTPQGNNNENRGGKKRSLSSENSIGMSGRDITSGRESTKRQRADGFVLDLSDVPPKQPIPKSKGCIKEGASKYKGVSFDKVYSKWKAVIKIEGKGRHIGYYEKEEEAAVDFARAAFKYKGKGVLKKAREMKKSPFLTNGRDNRIDGGKKHVLSSEDNITSGKKMATKKLHRADWFDIDLSDVPPQLPIPKNSYIKEGASKYTGVSFHKASNKWMAQINIDGKVRHIGLYVNEEEAGVDYARAVLKYKGLGALHKESPVISNDFSYVPPQPLIHIIHRKAEGI